MPNDDLKLLREYSRSHSEPAFATLVSRHVNLVYSVAMRQVRDPHLSGEITQAVFIILARKADKLSQHTVLPGWLCRTARYVSARALRTEFRRQRREQEAYMQSILNEPESETWTHIAPLLDGAMEQLGRKDHDALVLRFFENKSLGEVGVAIGASEDTARMRVNRALEKLRKFFTKRGVSSTAETIAGQISANSVQAAPVALAKAVTAVALAKGAAASASTLTLIKGALKIMAWTKVKTTAVIGVSALIAIGTTTMTVREIRAREFYIGESSFLKGDSIKIASVSRTKNQMVVKGQYNLVSADSAQLALYITTSQNVMVPTDPGQTMEISSGQGNFELSTSHPVPGWPHISMYSTNGPGFAGVYFGTKKEAAEERVRDIGGYRNAPAK
jgi:RNA polymerase sigma factor (sigma-70 family)